MVKASLSTFAKLPLALSIFLLLVLPLAIGNAAQEVDAALFLSNWAKLVDKKDNEKFLTSVNPSGVLVIRYYNSGGNSARGQNIRRIYRKSEIKDIEFPVKNEASVSIYGVFFGFESASISLLPITQASTPLCNMSSTQKCLNTLSLIELPRQIYNASCLPPCNRGIRLVRFSDGSIAITDISEYAGIVAGGLALFEKLGSEYRLISLVDIR